MTESETGKSGRIFKTQEEASAAALKNLVPGPSGWIQWKGTNVCMDIYCKCGYHSHIDAEFAYYVKCPACGRTYACNGNIELIEFMDPPQEDNIGPIMDEAEVDPNNYLDGAAIDNFVPKRIDEVNAAVDESKLQDT